MTALGGDGVAFGAAGAPTEVGGRRRFQRHSGGPCRAGEALDRGGQDLLGIDWFETKGVRSGSQPVDRAELADESLETPGFLGDRRGCAFGCRPLT